MKRISWLHDKICEFLNDGQSSISNLNVSDELSSENVSANSPLPLWQIELKPLNPICHFSGDHSSRHLIHLSTVEYITRSFGGELSRLIISVATTKEHKPTCPGFKPQRTLGTRQHKYSNLCLNRDVCVTKAKTPM